MPQFNDTVDFRKKQMQRSLQNRVKPPATIQPVVPPVVPNVTRTLGGPEGDTVLSQTPAVPAPVIPNTAPALPEDVSASWNQGAGQAGYSPTVMPGAAPLTPEQIAMRKSLNRRSTVGI
jgi:hypothetical protein